MPVLPLVGSISVSPGRMRPSRSAASTIDVADAVLQRAARVEELALRIQRAVQVRAHAVEPHERRAPDGLEDGVEQHASIVRERGAHGARVPGCTSASGAGAPVLVLGAGA